MNKDDNTHEFPAHSTIISAHSPVICGMIQASQTKHTMAARRAASFKCPMVGDSLPEMQGLLAATYEPFCTTKPVKADTIVEGDCFYNSWEHVEWWQAISIANKYGMMRLVTELEATVAGEMAAFLDEVVQKPPHICVPV